MTATLPDHFIKTFDNAPEKVCICNEENIILYANSAFTNFISTLDNKGSDHNITGLGFLDLLRRHMQEDELIITNIKNGIQQAKNNQDLCFTHEFPFYTTKNSYWLMFVACCQIDKTTGKKFIITKYYDVTDHHIRRKYENRKDDNNIVRQIIGESMHTWRQPLNTISLFVQDIKEQFDDNTLTKYYMNFTSRQIVSEITRLSASIDEMAAFYTNDTLEDTINVSEAMFSTLEKVDKVINEANIKISLNCHALANLLTEDFIKISDSFRIRCGTGTKKCFQGCNKGNIVVYGDSILFNYLIRMLLTLSADTGENEKQIQFDMSIENDLYIITVKYDHNPEKDETLEFLKKIFDQNFEGLWYTSTNENDLTVEMNFQEFKTKSPI